MVKEENWEENVAKKLKTMENRNKKASKIEEQIESNWSEKDEKEFTNKIKAIFPESKDKEGEINLLKSRFRKDHIKQLIPKKLGEEKEREYNKIIILNNKDRNYIERSYKRHGI